MEGRLESASKGTAPPKLPPYLHGCLAQESLDSGLRGISQQSWRSAVVAAGIECSDPIALFDQLVGGDLGTVTQAQIASLRQALKANADAILTAQISATRLLHHHQEVVCGGKVAAAALVIADPMMLSPHKVAAVYNTAIMDRLVSYCRSFDDNIRLLPVSSGNMGVLWQRAVYLSLLVASDKLTGSARLAAFETAHAQSDVKTDIRDLRALALDPETWGPFAQASGTSAESPLVQSALEALEAAYVLVVNQYREAVYDGSKGMDKFMPKP
jgi:hypothetical protein